MVLGFEGGERRLFSWDNSLHIQKLQNPKTLEREREREREREASILASLSRMRVHFNVIIIYTSV